MSMDLPKPSCKDRRAYFKWYYETHKKQCIAATEKWWKNHRDKLREKWKRKRINNREKLRLKQLDYRRRHLDECRRKNRKWHWDNREHRRDYMRSYYERNQETIKARAKAFYNADKARWWNYNQKRRSLLEQASANLEIIRRFVKRIKSKPFCYCYYCGIRTQTKGAHFDHIIPISKGGQHSIENLCVTCPNCNLSKNDSIPSQWRKHPQLFLDL